MRLPKRWLVCGFALGALVCAGCAASRPAETAPGAPPVFSPEREKVVLTYEPRSPEEAKAADELDRADEEARPVVEQARQELEQARSRYHAAEKAFAAESAARSGGPTKKELEDLYREMRACWQRWHGLVRKQQELYDKFFARYPWNWQAHDRCAAFLADGLLTFDAAAQWRKVIEMAPTFPYAYNSLATVYNHMGRDLEAIQLYRKAISLKPDEPMFHLNLAVNYSTHRGEASGEFGWDLPTVFRECIREYEAARALTPKDKQTAYDLASQYVLAKFFQLENTADEALRAWDYYLALDLTPIERAVAFRNVATIRLRGKKDPAEARKWAEKALALMPDDPSCKSVLDQCIAAEKLPAP